MAFFKSIHAITAVLAAAPSTLNINETSELYDPESRNLAEIANTAPQHPSRA